MHGSPVRSNLVFLSFVSSQSKSSCLLRLQLARGRAARDAGGAAVWRHTAVMQWALQRVCSSHGRFISMAPFVLFQKLPLKCRQKRSCSWQPGRGKGAVMQR